MEKLKETYKKYRAKVYTSLRKSELIDDPDKRRRLEDALPFKGVCEDMCPDYERVTRITEYDVKHEEKEPAPDGLTMWAEPSRMVKKFGRSAAGQDAPLPMDVRSVDALRRTTDYLLDDLLESDQHLPALHNFLWDRTRAVRKDFTFHSTKSPEEMKVLVYCFETITRFHATALHLLSRKGFAAEDFDQKQEIEQLGRSLLSLIEAYDDCHDKGVKCENEPEFRAYHLLLNTHDPFIVQRSLEWGKEPWFDSDEIQIVFSLIHAMQSVEDFRGPLRPAMGSTLSDSSFTNFFSIVESPKVSYTMACFAAVHFTHVRQRILKSLVKAYSRRRDWPRDITASALNRALRFDADEEAVQFAELHGFEFSSENADQPYLVLKSKRKHVPSPRVLQSYSAQLVERKRNKQSLPYIIHNTIYEEDRPEPEKRAVDNSDSLFVSQPDTVYHTDQPSKNNGVQKLPSTISIPQPTPQPPSIANTAANGFASFPKNPLFATPSTGFTPSPSAQQPTSTFSPASASASAPTASQPTTAFASPLSSLQSGSPLASQTQPSQAPAAQSAFSPSSTTPAFPPKSAEQGAFAFLNKTPGEPKPQAAQSVLSAPVKPGPASSFFPSLSSASTKDNTPSVTISPPTPKWQQGSTSQATDASGDIKHPTPPPSLSTSAAPSTSFFPPSTSSKEATPLQGTQAVSTDAIPNSTGGPLVSSVTNKTTPAPPPGSSILGLPPAGQITTPAQAKTSQASSLPPQAEPSLLKGLRDISRPSQVTQSPTTLTPERPRTTPQDPMGGLTKWYVMGDGGLMEQFTEVAVQDILQETFEMWQEEEAERKRKEEDQQSWEAARKHQVYNLRVKYFYRWQKNARTLGHRRILREGRAKMKAYREKERAAEKARRDAENAAEEEARRKAKSEENIAKLLHWDAGKSAQLRTEEQLLASGIFSGIRDEREAVRRVIREVSLADARKQQQQQQRSSRRSSIASSQATAPTPLKRDGWKTRSLREKYGADSSMRRSERRSNSVSSSVVGGSDFSRSLPAPKVTNFSRKRYAGDSSDDEPSPKRKANGIKSKHWELRARGLVLMPDGQWLPESIALPMQEGKRFKGIGDCGLGPGREAVDELGSDEEGNDVEFDPVRLRRDRLAERLGLSRPRALTTGATMNGTITPPSKRKRPIVDEGSPFEGSQGNGSPPSAKKRLTEGEGDDTQRMVEDTEKMLRELKDTMDQMDEDRPWFRQQIELMEKRQSMWD